jgi:hypothetical protein
LSLLFVNTMGTITAVVVRTSTLPPTT